MMFARHPLGLLLAAVLLTTACADDDSSSDSGATITIAAAESSACSLLTTEEVTAAVRKPMADGQPSEADDGTLCTWLSTDAPSEGLDSPIKLTVGLFPMRPAAQQKFDLLASSTEDRVVPGLGDLAVADCSFGDTEHCSELFVVLGDQYLAVDLSNFAWPADYDPADLLGIVTDVANQAILRVRR